MHRLRSGRWPRVFLVTATPRGLSGLLLGLGVLTVWLLGPAHAADLRWIDEVKLGTLAHDIRFLGTHVGPGADINAEVLFPSPVFFRVNGAPRPHLGLAVNTARATNYGTGCEFSVAQQRVALAPV
jgi:hypothetical protein